MIRELRRRLDRLEQAIADSVPGPWPPEPGSFSYLLWDGLGRPLERQGFMSMYMQSAQNFYEEQQK